MRRSRGRAVPSGLTPPELVLWRSFAIVAASRELFMQARLVRHYSAASPMHLMAVVARATNSEGRFGEELDSLVDAITFGLAPAMIMYFAVMNRAGWDWLWCFAFTACAVLRLARFNVEQDGTNKSYFHGLPSPAPALRSRRTTGSASPSSTTKRRFADWSWHRCSAWSWRSEASLMISTCRIRCCRRSLPLPKQLIGLGVFAIERHADFFGRLEYFFPIAVVTWHSGSCAQ